MLKRFFEDTIDLDLGRKQKTANIEKVATKEVVNPQRFHHGTIATINKQNNTSAKTQHCLKPMLMNKESDFSLPTRTLAVIPFRNS